MTGKVDLYGKIEERVNRALEAIDGDSTISERNRAFIKSFIEKCRANGLSPIRQNKLMFLSRKYARALKKDFDTCTEADIRAMLNVFESAKKKDGLSPNYSSETKRNLKAGLLQLFKHVHGVKQPPESVAWVKVGAKKRKMRNRALILEEGDIKRLIHASTDLEERLFVSLLYQTGGRLTEVLSVRFGDCSISDGRLLVTLHGFKTGGDPRTIPVPDLETIELFQRYVSDSPRRSNLDAVLWSTGYSYSGISKRLKNLGKLAGMTKPINALWFRHSRATFWGDAGFNREELMQLLGHRSPEMAETYLETPPQERVFERFNKLFPSNNAPDALDREILKEYADLLADALKQPVVLNAFIEGLSKAGKLDGFAKLEEKAEQYGKLKSPHDFTLKKEAPGGTREKVPKSGGNKPY